MISPAGEDDLDACVELLGFLFEQEEEFTPDTERQKAGLLLVMRNLEAGFILVARRKDSVAGMILVLKVPSTALGGWVGVIEDFIVHPDARNQGIGSQLFDAAVSHADKIGLLRLSLLTDAGNTQAQSFYERRGFEKSGMVLYRRLDL